MKKVDTAKIRRIITWIIILIVLFILQTGLCLFIFFDMTRSCFSSANECSSVVSMERVQKRKEIMKSMEQRMERMKSMEQRMEQRMESMERMEQRMERMEQRMERMEQRMEQRMERMEQRMESMERVKRGRMERGRMELRMNSMGRMEQRMERVEGVEPKAKNMDSDDLKNAMKKMESNR